MVDRGKRDHTRTDGREVEVELRSVMDGGDLGGAVSILGLSETGRWSEAGWLGDSELLVGACNN